MPSTKNNLILKEMVNGKYTYGNGKYTCVLAYTHTQI